MFQFRPSPCAFGARSREYLTASLSRQAKRPRLIPARRGEQGSDSRPRVNDGFGSTRQGIALERPAAVSATAIHHMTMSSQLELDLNIGTGLNVMDIHKLAKKYQRVSMPHARRLEKVQRLGEQSWWFGQGAAYRAAKRTIDLAGALILLLLLCPLMAVVAALIKLTDRGPVLFWQRRVGLRGELFGFPKFRSMVVEAEHLTKELMEQNHHGNSITFKMKDDPRITWIGKFIRRFSIDEVPQLWCVLLGHMSLVGPRPALPREVANYSQLHRRRLDVRPGLTCIWQVNGRADVPFEGQVEMDIDYVESHGFWLDMRLLLATVPTVLSGRGAY